MPVTTSTPPIRPGLVCRPHADRYALVICTYSMSPVSVSPALSAIASAVSPVKPEVRTVSVAVGSPTM